MKPLFICYPKCSTCRKAQQWLKENNIEVETRDIVLENPTAKELSSWIANSKLPITRFFNTSGMRYRELGLKDKIRTAHIDELIKILATDGMLVKRPLLVTNGGVLLGFKEQEWSRAILEILER